MIEQFAEIRKLQPGVADVTGDVDGLIMVLDGLPRMEPGNTLGPRLNPAVRVLFCLAEYSLPLFML